MGLSFLSGKKFVISIGDDGTVLTFLDKGKLVTKLFAASSSASDRREFNTLLLKHPSVPISILLDSVEQTYSKQTLPAVSSFSIGKLVKRRLERDFAKTDITGAIPLGRDTKGRKDWQYMFVSTPTTPTILEWLDYFATLPNNLEGIYLLPIEMENVIGIVNKSLFKGDAERKNWQFIVTHNKTGGFRQTILNNDKVVFTRLIRPGRDSLPDIIAGNIEQEIVNTIDYLRRLGLSDDDAINIFVVVSQDLKNSLAATKIRGKPLLLFTPFEVTKMLNLDAAAGKDAKFVDVLLATIFSVSKPILRLDNPRAKKKDNSLLVYKLAFAATVAIIPTLVLYSFFKIYGILSLHSKIKNAEDQKANIEKQWKSVKNTDQYNLDDANKITDAMTLRRKIIAERKLPTDLLQKLAEMNVDFIKLESFTWNYDKDYMAIGKPEKISAILNLNFSTKGGNIDEMLKNYDIMKTAFEKQYSDMAIDLSKLPDKLSFDSKTENLPIQVKLSTKDGSSPGMSPQGGMPPGAPYPAGVMPPPPNGAQPRPMNPAKMETP